MVNKKKVVISALVVLIISLFAYFVLAGDGGFKSEGLDSVIGLGSNPSILNPTATVGAIQTVNISGSSYNLTLVLLKNGTHNEFITNISIMFQNKSDDYIGAQNNITISNTTGDGANGCIASAPNGWNCTNRTFWNYTFDTTTLADGIYNLTVFVHNTTYNGSWPPIANIAEFTHVENNTVGVNITVDNTAPDVKHLLMNLTNGTNLSTATGNLAVNVTSNDTTTYVKSVLLGFTVSRGLTVDGAIGNESQFNVSAPMNYSFHHALVDMSKFSDGRYNIRVYSNDSLENLNNSVANRSFTIDTTPPNVTAFDLNMTNGTNLSSAAGVYSFNLTANDTTTYTQSVRFEFAVDRGLTTGGVIGNTSRFNVTAPMNYTGFSAEVVFSSLGEGFYTVHVYAEDSAGNINNSVSNISFAIDSTPPNVSFFTANFTNGTNFSSATGVYGFNATVNDTTTVAKSAIFGFNIDGGNNATDSVGNVTQFNVTASLAGGNFSAVVPFSTLSDGRYTVRVYANDTVDNMNNSENVFGFAVDTTAPNVTAFTLNLTNGTNLSTAGGVYGFNATVNDTTTVVKSVIFGFTIDGLNNSNNQENISQFNVTASLAGGNFSAVVPFSTLSDGHYTVRVYANDTVDNMNNSVNAESVTSFTIDTAAPNVTAVYSNLTNATNLSSVAGVYHFNVTANDTTTHVKSVLLGFTIARGLTDDGAIGNVSQFNVTASPGSGTNGFSATVPLSTLTDGFYSVRVYATDTVDNLNSTAGISSENLTFTIDSTPPNVSLIGGGARNVGRFGNFTNGFNLSNGIAGKTANLLVSFNATINDTTTYVQSVLFNLSNNSGLVQQWNGTGNKTGVYNTSSALNISDLAEGDYFMTVWANDTLGNTNYTENITFTVDRAASISVTCDPSSPTAGETVTCTCSGTDAVSGFIVTPRFPNKQSTEETTATGSGTYTSSTCEAEDYAGNIATATGTWDVTAAEAGGGGAGGAGGGASSGVAGAFEKKTWTSINAGETATVDVKNGVIGVTEVSFDVTETVWGSWINIKKRESFPSSVASPEGKVYRRVEISKGIALKDDLVQNAKIKFKVLKSWLTENKLGKNEVALLRYVDGKWTELPTTTGEDDGTYIFYTAETPGFSYFVIGQKGVIPEEVPVEEVVAEEVPAEEVAPEEVPVEEEVVTEPVVEKERRGAVQIIAIVIAVILALILYWYWKKK